MAQSKASKRFMNMAYGLGASIVIIGALFKIIHFQIGPLTGNVMLTLGLVTEAIIFAISAVPFLLIVLSALVESLSVTNLFNSCTHIFFFCRFGKNLLLDLL